MGIYPITYKRPAFVPKDQLKRIDSSTADQEKASLRKGTSSLPSGIPPELSFDNIIGGFTCPPVTLREFMNYLLYIEHAAENLQFYLWYQDFAKRFPQASKADLALSPEWTKAQEDETIKGLQRKATGHIRGNQAVANAIFKGTDFENTGETCATADANPFSTPPQTPASGTDYESNYAPSTHASTTNTHTSMASDAFTAAGAKRPFTIQPFREEIDRIISTYIMDGAPRQINLSDRDRRVVMHALSYTTHPSAVRTALQSVELSLRRQSHPNFIRWSIWNGNPARISFARTLGYAGVLAAFTIAILLTLSSKPRSWRAVAALCWVPGITTVFASYRGMCVCMYSVQHHHIRPWELFLDGAGAGAEEDLDGLQKRSFETFASGSNSFEHEPWVARYERLSLVRKIFSREVWIREPALRAIQNTLFVQALLVGVVSAAALTGIFVALPKGNFF